MKSGILMIISAIAGAFMENAEARFVQSELGDD